MKNIYDINVHLKIKLMMQKLISVNVAGRIERSIYSARNNRVNIKRERYVNTLLQKVSISRRAACIVLTHFDINRN